MYRVGQQDIYAYGETGDYGFVVESAVLATQAIILLAQLKRPSPRALARRIKRVRRKLDRVAKKKQTTRNQRRGEKLQARLQVLLALKAAYQKHGVKQGWKMWKNKYGRLGHKETRAAKRASRKERRQERRERGYWGKKEGWGDYGRMLPALAVGHTPYDRLKPYMPWLLLAGGVALMMFHEKPKKKRARRRR